MFARILVLVHSQTGAGAAGRLGARLAQVTGARLHACFVVDRSLVRSEGGTFAVDMERAGQRALRRVQTLCRKLRVPYGQTLAHGDSAEEILRVARRVRAQLIVTSTRGLGRVGAFLFGSLTQDLVGRAPCPLLLVREGTRGTRGRSGSARRGGRHGRRRRGR